MLSLPYCVLFGFLLFVGHPADGFLTNFCSTVHLLHVVPSSDNEELSGWNKTELDVLQIAKKSALNFINNHSDLLPGIKLEILDISTDDCSRDSSLQDLIETFKLIVSKQKCVLGIIGLYCSRVTRMVSSILSHENFGYVQLSASSSPLLRNKTEFPYLYRTISSSVVFNQAVIEMMRKYTWTSISLVYDFSDIFFKSTAVDFVNQLRQDGDFNLKLFFPIRASENHEVLEKIVRNESRVTYFSVTHRESSDILCDAYKHRFFWPDHIYIFVAKSLKEMLAYTGNCTREQLLRASDHAIFLLNQLNFTSTDSRINYKNYQKEREQSGSLNVHGMEDFANVLYDQIWAMSFAINNSMSELNNIHLRQSVQNTLPISPKLRKKLAMELKKVRFQGASGNIAFTENREVLTKIEFFQILNGEQVQIGEYDPINNITNVNIQGAPKGYYETKHDAILVGLGIFVAFSQTLLAIMFILTVVYIVYQRKAPEIKSTSLLINVIILAGCSMIMTSSLFYNLVIFSKSSEASTTVFCNLESWFFLSGISAVLLGFLFRLMRIFIIFRNPNANIKLLTNKFLFLYFVLIFLVPFFFQLIWTAADNLKPMSKVVFHRSVSDIHYNKYFYCFSQHLGVWLGLYGAWIGALLVVLMVLAVQTRHIKYNNFKDTKKISAFVFLLSFVLATLFPSSLLLQKDVPVVSYILKSSLTTIIPASCLLLQYFPKLFPNFKAKTESCFGFKDYFKSFASQDC